MTDWSTFFEEERERVMKLIRESMGLEEEPISLMRKRTATFRTDHINPDNLAMAFFGTLKPPPTREQIIKAVWAEAEPQYPDKATAYGLIVVDPNLGEFDFEPKRYGDEIVIECEGVVVRRDPMIDIEIR